MSTIRIHVYKGSERTERTTISLDDLIYGLLCIKLGHTPNDKIARSAVRSWVQEKMDDVLETENSVSRAINRIILMRVADKKLVGQYLKWKAEQKKRR
jgi:hypothetical protein